MNMFQGMFGAQMAQYALQGLFNSNPAVYKQCQSMLQNKTHKAQVSELRRLYKSKGMDLDQTARQWGITL